MESVASAPLQFCREAEKNNQQTELHCSSLKMCTATGTPGMKYDTYFDQTHPLVKVYGVADEGRVVVEAEAGRALWHFALQQQLLVQLDADARLKHAPVAQAVDHDDHVVVELTNGLPADVKGLLENTSKNPHDEEENARKGKSGRSREESRKPRTSASLPQYSIFTAWCTIF